MTAMQVLHDLESLRLLPGPVYLAIGIFDGVHRGHRALVAEAQADAVQTGGTAVVMTFEPHPMMFFQHAKAPLRLSSPRHKEVIFRRLGVTHLAVLPFEAKRAGQPAEDFVAELTASCRPLGGICVGAGWRFGKGRSGDVSLLEKLGADQGFEVDGISAVEMDSQVVSSTAIRERIAGGDLKFAERALGRPYAVLGEVVRGRQMGRRLGFPTANIETEGFQLPPDGVYAARARVGERFFPSVVNLGKRPTLVTSNQRVLEAHLLDFHGDLYGQELEIEFLHFLRAEKVFPAVDDLRRQIARDVEDAINIMKPDSSFFTAR